MVALEYNKVVISTFQLCTKQRRLKAGTTASIDATSLHPKATKQSPNTLYLQVGCVTRDDAQDQLMVRIGQRPGAATSLSDTGGNFIDHLLA